MSGIDPPRRRCADFVELGADGKAPDEIVDGIKVAEWLSFVERLYGAKRKADKRIAELGGPGSSVSLRPRSQRLGTERCRLISARFGLQFCDTRRFTSRSLHLPPRHPSAADFALLLHGVPRPSPSFPSSPILAPR